MQKNTGLLVIAVLMLSHLSFSQKRDSANNIIHFSGSVSVTNNGISLIPTFSLGKPAAIFNTSIGTRKLSFEPELRFSLEGKPWSFIFWWRYKLLNTDKFLLNVGAHPALTFKTVTLPINGKPGEITVKRRYLAGELSPNYLITKNVSIGMYYLYSRGIDEGATKNTHFLKLNVNFLNIKLPYQLFMKAAPQLYYLKLDDQDGFYYTGSMTLARRNFPLSVSAIINKTIQTNIKASKDLVWNATLTYSFNKSFVKT